MSSAVIPSSSLILARISCVHGSAPSTPARSDSPRVSPASASASPSRMAYDGVQVRISGRRSAISVTCRAVIPPETGTTSAPSSIAPWWIPSPPVNSPYP